MEVKQDWTMMQQRRQTRNLAATDLGQPWSNKGEGGKGKGSLRRSMICVALIVLLLAPLMVTPAVRQYLSKQEVCASVGGLASKLVGPSYTQNAGESEFRVIRHLAPKRSSCFEPPFGNIIEGEKKDNRGKKCLPDECSGKNTRCQNTFGQCHQDMCLISRFGNLPGYYLDLGANHPFKISNTYGLDRYYNWSGLCIEAQEDLGILFLSHRTCMLAQTLISNEETTLEFVKNKQDSGLSGVLGYDNSDPNSDRDTVLQRKQTFKLEDVLDKAGAPSTIDYFSFDVEGMEFKILKSFDFSRYGFRYMTVERPGRELHEHLVDRGFCVLSNGCSFTDIWYQNGTLSTVSNAATKEWCNEYGLPDYIDTKDVCK